MKGRWEGRGLQVFMAKHAPKETRTLEEHRLLLLTMLVCSAQALIPWLHRRVRELRVFSRSTEHTYPCAHEVLGGHR